VVGLLYYSFTSESEGERILKIDQHLVKSCYWCYWTSHVVCVL